MDYWRKFFRTANTSISEVIEKAITIAAEDSPQELLRKRDQIAVLLFSCNLERESSPKREDPVASNFSFDEAEALTEEIEQESEMIGEVFRIKEVLLRRDEESDGVLFESLRRLELMGLSVEVLKVTEIGKAVNGLRKHKSKQIRTLVRSLIDGWKNLVDEWVSAASLTESTPESVNPSVVSDEGLPSPPLDDGLLFSAQPGMEFSQVLKFFDGLDEDGNIKSGGELKDSRGPRRKADIIIGHDGIDDHDTGRSTKMPAADAVIRHDDRHDHPMAKGHDHDTGRPKKMPAADTTIRHDDRRDHHMAKSHNHDRKMVKSGAMIMNDRDHDDEIGMRRSEMAAHGRQKKTVVGGGPGRPEKAAVSGSMPKKPMPGHGQDKYEGAEEMSVRVKLEAAKRKLHEGYQQAENAKKQRTIQVMELQDIPRQGLGRNAIVKQGSTGRLRGAHGHR